MELINLKNYQLEKYIAYYCAPVIFGIKASSTIIIKSSQSINFKYFVDTQIKFYEIAQIRDKKLYLIFRKELLMKAINNSMLFEFMNKFYKENEVEYCLRIFSSKYKDYLKKQGDFPHELGIFLDYPPKDVIEFIKNNGANYKICGYWKVYDDVKKAMEIFVEYDKSKSVIMQELKNGKSINYIYNKIKI